MKESKLTTTDTWKHKNFDKKERTKFASTKHEADHVFKIHQRKLGMRVLKEDFQLATREDLYIVDKSVVFKGPKWKYSE